MPAETTQIAETSTADDHRGGLGSRSFLGLLATQFLGAVNDNMFRWLVVPIGKEIVAELYGPKHVPVALSAGLACFVVPYILLAAPAGHLADRYSKRTVIVACKVAELVIMLLGVAAILTGGFSSTLALCLMFAVVALMGSQSALFSPSKFGSIPEIVRSERISAANGLVGMTTVLAIVVGTVAGNLLYVLTKPLGLHLWWIWAAALIGVASVGLLCSLLIQPLRGANPARTFPFNAAGQTIRDLGALASNRPLFRAALGTMVFWGLGALAQMNVDRLVGYQFGLGQEYVGISLAVLALGIGVGCLLAGLWSAGRVELGIVSLGAGGIAVSAILLSLALWIFPAATGALPWAAFVWACLWLLMLGISAGLYDVPIQAFLQHRSPSESLGSILAASNLLTNSAMLLAAGLFWVCSGPLGLGPEGIFLLLGIATVPVFLYVVWLLPGATVRCLVWLLSHTIYRVRVEGRERVPERGGALLVSNHVSYIDGILLLLHTYRPIRMVAYADYVQRWWIRYLAKDMGTIPISPGKRSVVESIRTARQAVRDGELVCIFPEGHVTRTGQMGPFRPGFLSILKGTGAPLIPIYLGGLWGSIFSYERGKVFWKWPRRWPYPVWIRLGPPIIGPADTEQVRQAVASLGEKAMERDEEMILPGKFLRMCRANLRRTKVADSSGAELTGAQMLTRALVLRRLLRREVLGKDEQYVGLLLPPSTGAVLANAALALDRRVAVNLNYSESAEVVAAAIEQAGLRRVLTSRRVMESKEMQRFRDLGVELVYLEDLKDRVTMADKLAAAAATWLMPASMLQRRLGLTRVDPDDVLAVIFTAGSTGIPKGVMLTHRNVGSNMEGFDSVLQLKESDVLVGILPFFHSFGYTVTLWTALTLPPKVVYHYSPREPRPIGKLCRRHGATILIATPTFLRWYTRGCQPEDFAKLDVVITGAEKLPVDLADKFEEKFGIRPVEGYGTTELSPVVGVNVPPSRMTTTTGQGSREGTIGRPLPGVAAKVVDPETGEDLGVGRSGMLLIKGPNVMKGYLGKPELTARVIRDGWYETGDIAEIDADGFIKITGRQSRFAKIGGEMVPLIQAEEQLMRVLNLGEENISVAVTAIPDAKKGERLVVLHTGLAEGPEEVCRKLAEAGLKPICIPSPDSFRQVEEIPLLGSGKLDLRRVKQRALEEFGIPEPS